MHVQHTDVQSVKVYFINSFQQISLVVKTLIGIEYEAYEVGILERESLLSILPANKKSVIFYSIKTEKDVIDGYEFLRKVLEIKDCNTILGCFIYPDMGQDERFLFLTESIPLIEISELNRNKMEVLRRILMLFEAKGRRKYLIVNCGDQGEARFELKHSTQQVVAGIVDISAYAFCCKIKPKDKRHFNIDSYFHNVIITLRGNRSQTAIKVAGFSKTDPHMVICKLCSVATDPRSREYVFTDKTPQKVGLFIHDFIGKKLDEKLKAQMKKYRQTPGTHRQQLLQTVGVTSSRQEQVHEELSVDDDGEERFNPNA
jgi:hypothetical protein